MFSFGETAFLDTGGPAFLKLSLKEFGNFGAAKNLGLVLKVDPAAMLARDPMTRRERKKKLDDVVTLCDM